MLSIGVGALKMGDCNHLTNYVRYSLHLETSFLAN